MLARLKCLSPALLALLLAAPPPAAQEPGANPAVNPNVRFGLPAPAKASPESREAYLIERPQYVLSYNAKTRTPNWVSWVSVRSAPSCTGSTGLPRVTIPTGEPPLPLPPRQPASHHRSVLYP